MIIRGSNTMHLNFQDGTSCTVNKGSRLIMESESQVLVEPNCSLHLVQGSTLINRGGIIRIKAGGYFIVDSNAVANIWSSGSVILDSGATLIVNNTGILNVDSSGNLVYIKSPHIFLNGPNSELAINANLILRGDTVSFHYYKDYAHYNTYAGYCTFGPNINVTVENATRANMYFVGDSSNDVVLKVKGSISLPDSVYYPTHYIDSVILLNGQVEGIGTNPILTTGSKLFVRYCTVKGVTLKTLGQYADMYHSKFENAGYSSICIPNIYCDINYNTKMKKIYNRLYKGRKFFNLKSNIYIGLAVNLKTTQN